jgi:ribulose-5-phosphate 4-epimerase/fuculose-1-phosphate aldolase
MKIIYTEKDIEGLVQKGVNSIKIQDQTVFTELAYDAINRLGLTLIRETINSDTTEYGSGKLARRDQSGDIRQQIVKINNELYTLGLVTSTGGNISARDPHHPEEIWITAGSTFKGELKPEMVIRIDLQGELLDHNSPYRASSEKYVHTEIFKDRPEINAVIHTHAPQATTMALSKLEFLPISFESAHLGPVYIAEFMPPGTIELGQTVAKAMRGGFAVVMQNHGLLTAGSSLRSATDATLVVEQTAKKLLTCHNLGILPPTLPPELVEKYRRMGQQNI